jgi:hypothetical protein
MDATYISKKMFHEICRDLGKRRRMKLAWNFETQATKGARETYNIPDTS